MQECAAALTHQRPLKVESLGILTQQHHVFLQVVEAAVLMAPDPLLVDGRKQEEAAVKRTVDKKDSSMKEQVDSSLFTTP